jgi:hypothetical protein
MTSIPNTLSITINTSIPGHQIVKFKPNMLIQNISKDDNKVYFNPQIPLNQSIINKIPQKIRVLEFFNKGLFNSLINLHGVKKTPLPTLEEARNRGIIDNNIKITLNTLFSVGTVIYIDKKPYSVVDIMWNNGQWKLDTKPIDLKVIQPEKIMNPYLYNQYIIKQYNEGKKELENINDKAKYGPNYDKSKEKEKEPTLTIQTKKDDEVKTPTPKPAPQIEMPKPVPQIEAPKPVPQIEAPKPAPQIEMPKPAPQIEAPKSDIYPESEKVEEIIEHPMTINIDLPLSKDSTRFLRNYFMNNDFYYMINQIYLNMNPKQKNIMHQIYTKTTGINIVPTAINLSRKAYDTTIIGDKKAAKGLRIIHNEGGGNCFFISIADAINYYNSTSSNKIIYNNYGIGNNLFTQKFLRSLVSNYVLQNLNDYIKLSHVFSQELNKIFKQQIILLSKNENIDNTKYIELVNKIYQNNDNLLVKKPTTIPISNSLDFYNPFKSFNSSEKQQMKDYFNSSDYWADGNTVIILSNILKMNILTIVNKNGYLSISNANLKVGDLNNWNRYLFLYYDENLKHYELVTFDFIESKITKEPKIKVKKIINRIVIFDVKNVIDFILPPIYIIFLLFSTYYLSLDDISRSKIFFLKPYLDSIMNSFNNILNNSENIENNKFLSIFNKYFPNSYKKLNLQDKIQMNENNGISGLDGGAIQDYNYKYNPYGNYYGYPYGDYNPKYRGYSPYRYPSQSRMYQDLKAQKDSNLSYQITIDLELQKGDKLSPKLLEESNCINRLNQIKKSYANLTGAKYIIPPVYSLLYDKDNLKNNIIKNNITKKNNIKDKIIKRNKTYKNI